MCAAMGTTRKGMRMWKNILISPHLQGANLGLELEVFCFFLKSVCSSFIRIKTLSEKYINNELFQVNTSQKATSQGALQD